MKYNFRSKKFGIDLHGARWGRGIKSLAELGAIFGRSAAAMGRLERGEVQTLDVGLYIALCVAFELDPTEYVYLEEIEGGE